MKDKELEKDHSKIFLITQMHPISRDALPGPLPAIADLDPALRSDWQVPAQSAGAAGRRWRRGRTFLCLGFDYEILACQCCWG